MSYEFFFTLSASTAVEQQGQDCSLRVLIEEVYHAECHCNSPAGKYSMRILQTYFVKCLDAELSHHLVAHGLLHGITHVLDQVFPNHVLDALRIDVH